MESRVALLDVLSITIKPEAKYSEEMLYKNRLLY